MNDDKRKLSTPNKRRSLNPRNYQNPVGGSITDPLNVKGDAADEVKGIQKRRYSMKSLINNKAVPNQKKEISAATRSEKRQKLSQRYRYGNFNYFHRYLSPFQNDPRTVLMCDDWFSEKDVLDIGCNAGQLALSIARIFGPRSILGVDIDKKLIDAARKNIRHFYDKDVKVVNRFPASFALNFGPICLPPTATTSEYPNNVWFRCENYVMENDEALSQVQEEYDTILAFGLTKWIHLNFGDSGIERFFQRVYKQLRPGGRFILEPQHHSKYQKSAKTHPELLSNYKKIKFFPDKFQDYLLSEKVGFSHCDFLDTPLVTAYGCDAPLLMLYKGPFPVAESVSSELNNRLAIFSQDFNEDMPDTPEYHGDDY